jgi:hypothetical protein
MGHALSLPPTGCATPSALPNKPQNIHRAGGPQKRVLSLPLLILGMWHGAAMAASCLPCDCSAVLIVWLVA